MNFGSGSKRAGGGAGGLSGAKRIAQNKNLSHRDRRALAKKIQQVQEFKMRSEEVLDSLYPSVVQFYDDLPGCDVGLIDFEMLAVERLKLLRIFEKHAAMSYAKYSTEWQKNLTAELNKANDTRLYDFKQLANYEKKVKFENNPEHYLLNRERDHFSHFILRLAYCKTEELRRWFVTHEYDLFRHRAMQMTSSEFASFVSEAGLQYTPVEESEIADMRNFYTQLYAKGTLIKSYYKVAPDISFP